MAGPHFSLYLVFSIPPLTDGETACAHISLDANQKFTATAPEPGGGRSASAGAVLVLGYSVFAFSKAARSESGASVEVPCGMITAHRLFQASATLPRMRGAFPHLIINSNSFISGVIPSHFPRCISLPPAAAGETHYPSSSDPAVMQGN